MSSIFTAILGLIFSVILPVVQAAELLQPPSLRGETLENCAGALVRFEELPSVSRWSERQLGLPLSDLNLVAQASGRNVLTDSPRLVVEDDTLATPNSEFYVSNESDWFLMEQEHEPTDVVIGFGANIAWDLAVRKNAKMLVLADWNRGTLTAQEVYFRPLILASESPGDFLSLISAVPVPQEIKSGPIEGVFRYIDSYYVQLQRNPRMMSDLATYITGRISAMRQAGTINDEGQVMLASVYEPILRHYQHSGRITPSARLQQQNRSRSFGPLQGSRAAYLMPLNYLLMKERYQPSLLRRKGANAQAVSHPFFSFLSSNIAFLRLKALFQTSVYYALASVDNIEIYDKAKSIATSRGLHSFTVATSNIFDCSAYPICSSENSVRHFLSDIVPLLATVENPLTFYQTRNHQLPHRFERHIVARVADIERVVVSNGFVPLSSEQPLQSTPFDYILNALKTETPVHLSQGDDGFYVAYGPGLVVNGGPRGVRFLEAAYDAERGILRLTRDEYQVHVSAQRRLLYQALEHSLHASSH